MKQWTIDEFLRECEELCRNQYTYDYSRMPEGVCNGHHVKPYMGAWHSIVIDGRIDTLTAITDEHPDGYVQWQEDGKMMTALEHLRYVLSK